MKEIERNKSISQLIRKRSKSKQREQRLEKIDSSREMTFYSNKGDSKKNQRTVRKIRAELQ